jgi:hypothetical protein
VLHFDDLLNSSKVVMASLCKAAVQNVTEAVREKFPELADKILSLHSDSSKSDKDGLANVNKIWSEKIFLAFSPLVGVGVNFSVKDHFDKMYGYATGESDTVRVFLQMFGRIRHIKSNEITICVSPRMNLSTRAQLFSLGYAEKHYESIIQKDHDHDSTILFKDEEGHLCETRRVSESVWNRLRGYKLQESLNSSSNNFITMLKHQVEAKGDIFVMDVAEEPVKKVVFKKVASKKDIDRITATPIITEKEFRILKDNRYPKESDIYSAKKFQMSKELSLRPGIPEEELNKCLRIYAENQKPIENILNYYRNPDENIVRKDECEEAKIMNINNAFKKVINALGCEFIPKNPDPGKIIGVKEVRDDDVKKNENDKSNEKVEKDEKANEEKNGKQDTNTIKSNNKIEKLKRKKMTQDDRRAINAMKSNANNQANVPIDTVNKPGDPENVYNKGDPKDLLANHYLIYGHEYFEDKIDQIEFTSDEINSLETFGRAKDKYEIVKMILSRFGIKVGVESTQVRIGNNMKKYIKKYKILYDIDLWSVLCCKIQRNMKSYQVKFIEYVTIFSRFDNLLNDKICTMARIKYPYDPRRIVKDYSQNESLIHKLAKNQIIKWLYDDENKNVRLTCGINGQHISLSFSQESYFIEYPVVIDTEFNSLNNLWSSHNNFKNMLHHDDINMDQSIYEDSYLCDLSPTYKWCIRNNLIPEYIFDAAISENGHIVYGIEIVYTNSVSEIKKQRIQESIAKSQCKAVIEISARWILEQNGIKPKVMELERLITCDTDVMAKHGMKQRNYVTHEREG